MIRPDGSFKELFKGKKVGLLLFPGGTEDICSADPVAAGTGNYTLTDNDLIVSGRRTNSFGFRIRGNVTDEGGEKHHVLVVVKLLFNGNFGLKENVQSVKVN